MKRHSDAISISDGACNPRAIVYSIQKAMQDDLGRADTDTVCNDPAIRLMVHQLAFLCGINDSDWRDWRDACEGNIEFSKPAKPVVAPMVELTSEGLPC